MKRRPLMGPLMDLASHGRYEGTFPRGEVPKGERLILEWKPSRILIAKGGPLLLILAFPGSFTLPFLVIVPLLALLGVLGWVLDHSLQLSATVFLGLAGCIYLFGRISWMRTSYAVTDKAVYVRTGMIFNRVYRTPLGDIVGVKVSKGLFERIASRGSLVFITKGGRLRKHPKVKWHFIKYPHRLRDSFQKVIDTGLAVDILERDLE